MNSPPTSPPAKPSKIANVLAWMVMLPLIGFAIWWSAFRETPVLTVHEALAERSGRMVVQGVVEPRLSAQNLAFRALDYGSTQLLYFSIRDESGVMGVYFDPADLELPNVGASVRAEGRKEMGPDHAAVFIASELAVVAPSN